jgi:Zn-dependent metalloprotease
MFAQNSTFKAKNKRTSSYSTSFTPIIVNNQNYLKSTRIAHNTLYQKIGTSPLKLQTVSAGNKKIVYGKDSLVPIFIERNNTTQLKSAKVQTAEQRCFSFLDNVKQELHIPNPRESFSITSKQNDGLGQQHIRLSQKYKGIRVYSSDFYVHFSGDREIMNGKYSVIDADINTSPKISADQALQIVTRDLKSKAIFTGLTVSQKELLGYTGPRIDTVIVDDKKSFTKFSVAYHIIIRPNVIDEWYYFVSAANGNIIRQYNNTKYDGPATATANDLNGVSRTINTYMENGHYTLVDASEPMYSAAKNEGLIMTLDAQNTAGSKYAEITSTSNTWNNPRAVSAHYNAKQAYLYFKNVLGRNSINGSGGSIYSFINVTNSDGSGLDNAFWSDKIMFYGNGNTNFKPLAGALDVAGHEMAHGVTQNSAALEYEGESGAINESFSDIFGAMIDRGNWYIGEEVTKTSYIATGRLRDMSNPHNGTTSLKDGWQPMHTNEMYLGTDDNGGVHVNSGICNYAYYLIATAITKEKAEQIFYRALTNYLTKSSQFIDLRIAVAQAAKDLYGDNSNEIKQIKTAFDAVGIYEEQPNTYVQTYPVNPGQDYLLMDNTDAGDPNSLYKSSVSATDFLPLSSTKMLNKISVTDDGSVGVFVSKDYKIRSITLGSSPSETIISSDAIWENVTVSKDGNRLAAITTEIDTAIYVYDFISQKWAKFPLYNPTTEGVSKAGGVLYADAIEFDHTGEYLIYDSYNVIRSTAKDSLSYWDIGIMRVWNTQQNKFGDGAIAKLFSNLPDSVSVGNPVFSKNSPNIIAFDYLYGENTYAVLGLNIETMDLDIIANNNTIGYPSFSKGDDKVAFNAIDNLSRQVIAVSPLNANKISPSANPTNIINDARWPVYYATGTRTLGFAPKANFSASFKTGIIPLSTTFMDQSTNDPTSWEWTFESGNPHTSALQNPVVTYSTPGTYAVTLKTTNNFGNNTVTKSGYIVVLNTTGIEETGEKEKFRVYPNPTTDKVEITLNGEAETNYTVEIFNSLGHLVNTIEKHKNEQTCTIDLSVNPSGIYLVRITSPGKTYVCKVLKK